MRRHTLFLILVCPLILSMGIGQAHASYPGNRCLELDGVDDHVGFTGEEAQQLTFELWIQPKYRIEAGSNSVYGHNRGFLFSIGTTVLGYFDYATGDLHLDLFIGGHLWTPRYVSYASSRRVWEPAWYHVTVVHNNPAISVYVNATVDLVANIKEKTPYSENYWLNYESAAGRIGTAINDTNLAFGGRIDEVRYWNTSRAPADITHAFARILNATEMESADLRGYWRLDDFPDTLYPHDASSKGVNAQLGAAPYTPLWTGPCEPKECCAPIVPEFSPALIMPLFLIFSALAVACAKKAKLMETRA